MERATAVSGSFVFAPVVGVGSAAAGRIEDFELISFGDNPKALAPPRVLNQTHEHEKFRWARTLISVLVFTRQEPDGHDGRQEAELEAEASIIRM